MTKALGGVSDARAVPLLKAVIVNPKSSTDLRKQGVRSAVKSHEGASMILNLAESDTLPADTRFVAQSELSVVRWPDIKTRSAKTLPPPVGSSAEPLPPVAQLLKQSGDPNQGKSLFNGKAVCSTCHQVAGQGVNFGPDLSQVGSKLGKDALYEAILDPSSGIAFGYEAWLVVLKSDDEAFGLLASETETDLSIRAPGGIVTAYKKSDILKREKQKMSIMPAGLQATMTPGELVDLVEYLVSLRK